MTPRSVQVAFVASVEPRIPVDAIATVQLWQVSLAAVPSGLVPVQTSTASATPLFSLRSLTGVEHRGGQDRDDHGGVTAVSVCSRDAFAGVAPDPLR